MPTSSRRYNVRRCIRADVGIRPYEFCKNVIDIP